MSRSVELIIKARNGISAGLASAGATLKRFGTSAGRIGKMAARGFLAMGVAAAAGVAKAIAAWAAQEAAENSLSSALRVHGDEVENNMEKMKKSASAIQAETAVGDENVLMRMSSLRMLGVQADSLDAAAKATIGLKSAGMEEAQAIKAVAMASQGQYTMLQRYIPALRTATNESEKAAIVNDFLTKGYQQQKDRLQTVSGQWDALKGHIGDAWEQIGKAIAQNDLLANVLKKASEAVQSFSKRVADWASGGGVTDLIIAVRLFYETARENFLNLKSIASILFASIADASDTAFTYAKNVVSAWVTMVVVEFRGVKDVILATFNAIKNPSKESFAAIGKAAKNASQETIQAVKDYAAAIRGENSKVTKRVEEALADRVQLQKDAAARILEVEQWAADKLNGVKIKSAEETAQELIKIAQDTASQNLAIAEKSAKDAADLAAEIAATKKTQSERDALVEKTLGADARDKLKAEAQALRLEAKEIDKRKFDAGEVAAKRAEQKAAPQKARDEAAMQRKLDKYRDLQDKGWKGGREMEAVLALDNENKAKAAAKIKEAQVKEAEAGAKRKQFEMEWKQREKTNAKLDIMNKKLDAFGAGG